MTNSDITTGAEPGFVRVNFVNGTIAPCGASEFAGCCPAETESPPAGPGVTAALYISMSFHVQRMELVGLLAAFSLQFTSASACEMFCVVMFGYELLLRYARYVPSIVPPVKLNGASDLSSM